MIIAHNYYLLLGMERACNRGGQRSAVMVTRRSEDIVHPPKPRASIASTAGPLQTQEASSSDGRQCWSWSSVLQRHVPLITRRGSSTYSYNCICLRPVGPVYGLEGYISLEYGTFIGNIV